MCAPCAFDSGFLGSVKVMGPEDLPGGGNASHSTPHNVTVMGIKLKNSVTGEKKKKAIGSARSRAGLGLRGLSPAAVLHLGWGWGQRLNG